MAFQHCIDRIMQAAGRVLTDDEVSAIFTRVHKAALDIKAGRVAPTDVGLGKIGDTLGIGASQDQMVQAVATRAAAELVHEAEVHERQAYLQVIKQKARSTDVDNLVMSGMRPLDAVKALIARDYSGRQNIESVEQRVAGVRDDLKRKIRPTWDALGNDWLGFFQDSDKAITLIRALRGEKTGDPIADKGAEAFHQAAEEGRMAFNNFGGNVGRRDDWGMPQHHSQAKVAAVGRDAWVNFILPMLDRTKYVDDLGAPLTDDQMNDFLGHGWNPIATNGISEMTPGQFMGSGKRANRNAEHRQIHFKDAESVIKYWETFGERPLIEILDNHIEQIAKDIAFIEKFGPNPDLTYKSLRDRALKDEVVSSPADSNRIAGKANKLDTLYEYAAGRIKPTANETMSNVANGIAHLNISGKLGGSFWASAFGDKVNYEAVSHLNDIPMVQRWSNELTMLNPANMADRRMLTRHGLMLDYVRNGLNRYYEGLGSDGGGGWSGTFSSVSGKFANSVMRVTGMNAINELRKGAFGLSLMDAIGHEVQSGKDFASLDKSDVRVLRTFGITKNDWAVWKLATPEQFRGNETVLTPEAIARIPDATLQAAGFKNAAEARRDAIVKLLGAVSTESDFAVVTPGWRERSQFYGNLQRGTVSGEITRSILQFKSFPWAFFQRGMDLIKNADGPMGKAGMSVYLIISTTLAGAMILQVREMLSGKDPRHMVDQNLYKFWAQAFLQGGALGIYGDFLYGANQTRYGSGILEAVSGPTLGPLLELGLVQPMAAMRGQMEGKDTHLAAKSVQDIKGFIPGNNIWYTKAVLDHLVWMQVMEQLSPGYLGAIRSKTAKEYNQSWWWQPGELSPDRGPDLKEALQ